jgi:hypothetical protein
MKLPNGYGSVVKLSGKRRKPWAVRISYYKDIPGQKPKLKRKYIGYYSSQKQALSHLAEYNNKDIVDEHEKYLKSPTFSELYKEWLE